jgi:hypothetical protein
MADHGPQDAEGVQHVLHALDEVGGRYTPALYNGVEYD